VTRRSRNHGVQRRQNVLFDSRQDADERSRQDPVGVRSAPFVNLLEPYLESAARLHIRINVWDKSEVETKYCAVSTMPVPSVRPRRDLGFVPGVGHRALNVAKVVRRDQKPSVLVTVCDVRQQREGVVLNVRGVGFVRLNVLYQCECALGHPSGAFLESLAPRLVSIDPSFRVNVNDPWVDREDGELVGVVVPESNADVVERGADIVPEVTYECGEVLQFFLQRVVATGEVTPDDEVIHIVAGLDIGLNVVGTAVLAQPKQLVANIAQVLLCPPDLDPPRPADWIDLTQLVAHATP